MARWWRKATGISRAKRAISKATGIPTTRSGRQRKAGRSLGCAVLLVALFFGAAVVLADDKPDVAELKKQLKEAEAKVAELKAKLAVAGGEATEFKDTKTIAPGLMKVGEKGELINPRNMLRLPIGIHKIVSILGDDSFILQPDSEDRRMPNVVVKGFPTKGLADGQLLGSEKRVWKVVAAEKHGDETLMVIRPDEARELKADPPKKIDPKFPKKK